MKEFITVQLTNEDPFIWLEDVDGAEALEWVEERNKIVNTTLFDHAAEKDKDIAKAIMDSPQKIPFAKRRGNYFYNLWKDEQNPKGIWRRTTETSYRSATPDWETLLDIDQLARTENEDWFIQRSKMNPECPDRAIIRLNRGGTDASVLREYDIKNKRFIPLEENGFFIEQSKSHTTWINPDELLVASTLEDNHKTKSGYPRIIKLWKRGTDLKNAPIIFEGDYNDVLVSPAYDRTSKQILFYRKTDFFQSEVYVYNADKTSLIDLPKDATVSIDDGWLRIRLKGEASIGGKLYKAGTYLISKWQDYLSGQYQFEVIFEPTPRRILSYATYSAPYLALQILNDMACEIEIINLDKQDQPKQLLKIPEGEQAYISPLDIEDGWEISDKQSSEIKFSLSHSGYLKPNSQAFLTPGKSPEPIKSLPHFFSTDGLTVTRHMATSIDGEQIPYMQIGPKEKPPEAPVLLTGYGGFEISMLPTYSGTIGKLWLERGGTYVVANIRGGGEFGPPWHKAGRYADKKLAHDDFAHVAKDLIKRGVAKPENLACRGGSNGGLLVGAMLARYPELFGAIVCNVPLLDMKRYTKLPPGASWIAEYGDPEKPEEWDFIKTFSPYQMLVKDHTYPPMLFMTSRKDDRVHPGHARKMAAKMEMLGYSPLFYEPAEGGHAGAADSSQYAQNLAIMFSFLRKNIQV